MRRLPVVLLVALLTSGCSTAAVSSPSPIPTAPPSLEPVASLSEPTTVPSPPAVGSPGCPTESPMSVATYKAADPACFGANDVTLTGWETIPSGIGGQSDHSTEPAWLGEDFTPDVLVDQLPEACSQEMCDPFLFVHVDPASKLEFERDGLYVVITGHVDDPISATSLGDTRYNDKWPDMTPVGIDARQKKNYVRLQALAKINREKLDKADQLNYDLFQREIKQRIGEYQFKPWMFDLGPMQGPQLLSEITEYAPFKTVKDYDNWIARLNTSGVFVDQWIALFTQGVTEHLTQPRAGLLAFVG